MRIGVKDRNYKKSCHIGHVGRGELAAQRDLLLNLKCSEIRLPYHTVPPMAGISETMRQSTANKHRGQRSYSTPNTTVAS